MIRTLLTAIALTLLSSPVLAKPVDGVLFYKIDNQLVNREVILDVPSRGKGVVTLSGKGFVWTTKDFRTFEDKGRTTFMAVFQSEFRTFKSTNVLKGTYVKSDNTIKYYGDVFKRGDHAPVTDDLTDMEFVGGFNFTYDR